MSALDLLIRRLMVQRACLDRAAELVQALPGPVVQLGLGDGSAYAHLAELMPRRDILVFSRGIDKAPDLAPSGEALVLGDPRETLPQAWDRLSRLVVLAHLNFPVTSSPRFAGELAPLVAPLLRPGAVVVSECALTLPGWLPLPLSEGVREGRHHLYHVA